MAPRPNIFPQVVQLLPAVELLGGEQVEAACPAAGEHLGLPALQPVLEDVMEEEWLRMVLLDLVALRESGAEKGLAGSVRPGQPGLEVAEGGHHLGSGVPGLLGCGHEVQGL